MTHASGGTTQRSLSIETSHSGLGSYIEQVRRGLTGLEKARTIRRMWDRDHTVWKPDPTEISNRLGWLTVPQEMTQKLVALNSFASDMAGSVDHVVLLGMGGSSLGPEALSRSLGHAAGYPKLIVLDSTVPSSIRRTEESIDPARTLFIVSSKSGGTIETCPSTHTSGNLWQSAWETPRQAPLSWPSPTQGLLSNGLPMNGDSGRSF